MNKGNLGNNSFRGKYFIFYLSLKIRKKALEMGNIILKIVYIRNNIFKDFKISIRIN